MKSVVRKVSLFLLTQAIALAAVVTGAIASVKAQSITPANDSANTIVNPNVGNSNQLDISGGTISQDGANLFHSFQKFGLNPNEIANFLSNPNIQNILGRVVGGDPSIINGLLQVTGGNAHLFLINPAGIVFGANASLNVPGDFTATTANGIGFGANTLNAEGSNNYNNLVGNPSTFIFSTLQTGSIVNFGNLAVTTGNNLNLIGGTVLSTGQLSAPGGNVTVVSVPGENLLRISQPGHLLSLEIAPSSSPSTITPATLPELLTGDGIGNAVGVSVNSNGQVELTGSGMVVDTGDVVAKNINVSNDNGNGGKITITANTGKINAGNLSTHALLGNGGTVNISALGNIQTGTISSYSDTPANAATPNNGGNVSISSSGASINIGNIQAYSASVGGIGGTVNLNAANNLTAGFVNSHSIANGGKAGQITLMAGGNIDTGALRAFGGSQGSDINVTSTNGSVSVRDTATNDPNRPIMSGHLNTVADKPGGTGANINVTSAGDINIADYVASQSSSGSSGAINLTSKNGAIIVGNDITSGKVAIYAPDAPTGNTVTLRAAGNISTGRVFTGGTNSSGNIDAQTTGGSITTSNLTTSSTSGNAGFVTLQAVSDIVVGAIDANSTNGTGGAIALTAANLTPSGDIVTKNNNIDFNGKVTANNNINVTTGNNTPGNINFTGTIDGGGDLTLTAGTGNIKFAGIVGGTTPLNSLTITNAAKTDIFGNISTNGNISLTSPLNLNNDAILKTGAGNAIALNGKVNGNYNLKLDTVAGAGNVVLGGDIGSTQPLKSFTVESANITVPSNITTVNGEINLSGIITLNSNTTFNAGTSKIAFGGKLQAGSNNLTLIADEINPDASSLGNPVTGTGNLVLQPFTPNRNIILGGTSNNDPGKLNLTNTELAALQNGFNSITIGRNDGSGEIIINPVTFNDPVTITSPAGNITVNGAITATDNASVNLNAINTILKADITTNNQPINIVNQVLLENNSTVTFNSGNANISFGKTIDGAGNLNLLAGSGNISFGGALGSSNPLASLSLNANNTTLPGNISTTGDISLNSLLNLTGSSTTTINSVNGTVTSNQITSAGKDISIQGNSLSLGNLFSNISGTNGGNISLTSNTGNVTAAGLFTSVASGNGGKVNVQSAGNINITNAVNTDGNNSGDVTLLANNGINMGNSISAGSPTATKGGNITLNSTSGDITVGGQIDAIAQTPGNVLVNSGGGISISTNIDVNSPNGVGGNVNLNAQGDINTQGMRTDGNTGGGNITLNSKNGMINFTSGGIVNAGSGNITLTANEINLLGGANSFRGSGNIFFQPQTFSQNITLGGANDSGTNTLDLTATDLATLQNGFNSITIGRNDSSSAIKINNATFQDPVKIQSPTGAGSITATGAIVGLDNATINLLANQKITTDSISTNGNNINITSNNGGIETTNSVRSYSSSTSGNITLKASGDIKLSDDLTTGEQLSGVVTAGDIVISSGSKISTGDISAIGSTKSGNITLNAIGDIITGGDAIAANSEMGQGGNISLTSSTGNILVDLGLLTDSTLGLNNGGNITVKAAGNITTGDILAGGSKGGEIQLLSSNGAINTLGGSQCGSYSSCQIDTSGRTGGKITLDALGNITTGGITSRGSVKAGDVSLTSRSGNIDISRLVFNGFNSQGGLDASGINGGSGGVINIFAQNGSITTDALNSSSFGSTYNATPGNGGTITLIAKNDINTRYAVSSAYGNSQYGVGTAGSGGAINFLSTDGSINIAYLASDVAANGGDVGNGGNITLNAQKDLTTGSVYAGTEGSTSGNGGAINFTSNDGKITTQGIDTSAYSTIGFSGNGGAITLNARDSIKTGELKSSSYSGNGGNVTLDPDNDIQVTSINAQGGINGTGGNVDITTNRFFRATGTFRDRNGINSSISTSGGNGSGSITIRHAGNDTTPFFVGSASTNGTAGAITTSATNTITPNKFYTESYTQGNIQILTGATLKRNPQPPIPPTPGILPPTPNNTSLITLDTAVAEVDERLTRQFNQYLGESSGTSIKTLTDAQKTLQDIQARTGVKPAIVYAMFTPSSDTSTTNQDVLDLVLVTPEGKPIRKQVTGTTRAQVLRVAQKFYNEISDVNKAGSTSYLIPAKQLYKWLIAPQEAELQKQGIQNLAFVMDAGLRSIPLAALHDGQQFLIEKYSLGMLPSISLTDTSYTNIKNLEVLAMGASEFTPDQNQSPLQAVPLEVSTIAEKLWRGKFLLNRDFTLNNLKTQRQKNPFGMIHLATHVDFVPGNANKSYIQLYDTKLRLDQVRQLGWNKPPVELLVLSACKSAFGDEQAELGFAGLAVQTGVKSAVASLWYVSDAGTLGLMTEFYTQLKTSPIKAEALRQAQLAMIRGQVKIADNQLISANRGVSLSPQMAAYLQQNIIGDLSHPFYWAPFTMIGSPW